MNRLKAQDMQLAKIAIINLLIHLHVVVILIWLNAI